MQCSITRGTAMMVQRIRKVGSTTSRLGPRLGRKVASSYIVQSLSCHGAGPIAGHVTGSACQMSIQGTFSCTAPNKRPTSCLTAAEKRPNARYPVASSLHRFGVCSSGPGRRACRDGSTAVSSHHARKASKALARAAASAVRSAYPFTLSWILCHYQPQH